MLGSLATVKRYEAEFEDDSDGGWKKKAATMRRLIEIDVQGERDLEMHEHWGRATHGVAHRNPEAELRAWFAYVQRGIRYQPAGVGYTENIGADGRTFYTPLTQRLVRGAVAFRLGYGDCTAYSVCGAAGAAIGGYYSDLVYISTRQDRIPSHVYLWIYYPARSRAKSVSFDASVREPLGWQVPASRITWREVVPTSGPWGDSPRVAVVPGLGGNLGWR